jgi:hypothetical protein
MIPLQSWLPELAQREARWVRIGPVRPDPAGPTLPGDEYAFVEYYCDDLECDCRRVFLEVWAKNQPGKVFASISYGWEKESFYRRKMPWDPDGAIGTVRGELDLLNQQSEFADYFLELFRRVVLDEPYRLRLRRHYRMLREELARRQGAS